MINRAMMSVLAGAVMISTSGPWVQVAQVSPTTAGFYRMFIGAICLLAICLFQKKQLWNGFHYLLILFPPAIFFALDLFFWHRSIHIIGPGLATILANLQVFFLVAIGFIFFKEKFNALFLLGLLMAFIGVFALIGFDWTLLTNEYRLGIGFGVLTALSYTGFILSMRKSQTSFKTLSPAANLALVCVLCSSLLAILVCVEGNSFVIPDLKSALSLLALGIFSQVLGWLLITSALPELRASIVGVILLLQPALSMLWDTLFFGRQTGLLDILGSVLVLTGIYLATRLQSNKLQATSN